MLLRILRGQQTHQVSPIGRGVMCVMGRPDDLQRILYLPYTNFNDLDDFTRDDELYSSNTITVFR